jgi:threonine/homoserine/homoserine lactone efflux protein
MLDIFISVCVIAGITYILYEGWYALKDKQAAWEKRKVKKLRKKTYVLKD